MTHGDIDYIYYVHNDNVCCPELGAKCDTSMDCIDCLYRKNYI